MNKKEWKTEVRVNGIPRLCDVPKDLMDVFVEGLVENIEKIKKSERENNEK